MKHTAAAIVALLLLNTGNLFAEDTCTVNSVHDGDTLRATCDKEKIKVRFYCIDAPEVSQRPWGAESRDYLRKLLPHGSQVRIIRHGKDRYGRVIGEVLDSNGTSTNLTLVQEGQAAVYPKYCNERRFYKAQDQAKAARSGIWSRSGLQQTPWVYRHR